MRYEVPNKRTMNLIFQITFNKNTIISNSRHRMFPKVTSYQEPCPATYTIYTSSFICWVISTQHVYLSLASWLHQVRFLCFYLQDLSNIFQYDLMTYLNETFCIRLLEAFCIRLIESTHVQRTCTYFEIAETDAKPFRNHS